MQVNKMINTITLIACAMRSTGALAEEPQHFGGKKFSDITTALSTFHEYNERLERKLEGDLKPIDLHEIHELTYTIEDALAYITNSLYKVAEDLESVHVATEYANPEKVATHGALYLKAANQIIR